MIYTLPSYKNVFHFPSRETMKNSIYSKVYTVKNSITQWCSSDCKIYTFLILGRVLQAAAIAVTLLSIATTLIVGPIALAALVPSAGAFLLGHVMVHNNIPARNVFLSMPVLGRLIPHAFVPGQPVGLPNIGNSCWINASLQCIIHVPVLRERASQIPELAEFIENYLHVQNTARTTTVTPCHSVNNFIVRQLQNRRRTEFSFTGQADATAIFEWLLHQNPLFEFTQRRTLNGQMTETNTIADLIRLELDPLLEATVPELFKDFLDHTIADDGSHLQWRFNTAPETLAVLIGRYNFVVDPMNRSIHRIHIRRPVDGVDTVLTLLPGSVLTLEETRYECVAFIVHYGSFEGGHYIAYVKKEGNWWRCNDADVCMVSEQEANQKMKESYLFFSNRIAGSF